MGRAAHWVGQAWVGALADAGVADAAVHTGPLVTTRWSAMVCFAGRAPGEVLAGERKVVGVAQRRSPAVARFQCGLQRHWDSTALVGLLALSEDDRRAAARELAVVARGVDRPFELVVDAFLTRLPRKS